MARIYISVGSNIEAEKNIRGATAVLRKKFGNLIVSSVYESEAVGFEGDNFLNLVMGADTKDDVVTVNRTLHEIEDQFGRDRTGPRFSSRTLDLDLLVYDDVIMNESGVQIPRHEITENAFVLWPLAEIAPALKHPRLNITYTQMWEEYDKFKQQLSPIDFDWD